MLSGMATPPASVIRSWSAPATSTRADADVDHSRSSVLPRRPTHRGATVRRRRQDGLIRITVLRFGMSMAAVSEFAGADADAAVVEPAARGVLADFDARAEHLELTLHAEP